MITNHPNTSVVATHKKHSTHRKHTQHTSRDGRCVCVVSLRCPKIKKISFGVREKKIQNPRFSIFFDKSSNHLKKTMSESQTAKLAMYLMSSPPGKHFFKKIRKNDEKTRNDARKQDSTRRVATSTLQSVWTVCFVIWYVHKIYF